MNRPKKGCQKEKKNSNNKMRRKRKQEKKLPTVRSFVRTSTHNSRINKTIDFTLASFGFAFVSFFDAEKYRKRDQSQVADEENQTIWI